MGKDEEEEPKRANKWAQHIVNYDALYEQGDNEVEEEVKDDEEEIVEEEDIAEEEEVKEEEEEPKRVNKWAQHTVNYDALYEQGDDEVEEEVKKDEEEIVEEEEIAEEEEEEKEEEEPKRVNKWAQHTVNY